MIEMADHLRSARPNRFILEIAVSTPDEAVIAAADGADRLELSSGLELGGLTPSLHLFLAVREVVTLPIYVLLRPRPGGFQYSETEFELMLRDAGEFLNRGASGIVYGVLSPGGIDRARCERLVKLSEGRAVFHRAFDIIEEPFKVLEELIELGFERLLTSGQSATAESGASQLTMLIRQAGKRLEILPAGNIRRTNVIDLVRQTNCNQVHSSARGPIPEPGFRCHHPLATGMGLDKNGSRLMTDPNLVAGLRRALDRYTQDTEENDLPAR